jgi:hypothetical protein
MHELLPARGVFDHLVQERRAALMRFFDHRFPPALSETAAGPCPAADLS